MASSSAVRIRKQMRKCGQVTSTLLAIYARRWRSERSCETGSRPGNTGTIATSDGENADPI
jgi:hypothetical protein